jgi:hypothetical protein
VHKSGFDPLPSFFVSEERISIWGAVSKVAEGIGRRPGEVDDGEKRIYEERKKH